MMYEKQEEEEEEEEEAIDQQQHQTQQQQLRRPRGFAARTADVESRGGSCRKDREREKERTKLRERHRRAITSRMLAGLRQYGNFPLPARADMNDVLASLAREAGWTVDPDGTTYRPSSSSIPPRFNRKIITSNNNFSPSLDSQASLLTIEEGIHPHTTVTTSSSSVVVAAAADDECIHTTDMFLQEPPSASNFDGTPYIPVYVMLPTGTINSYCQLVDPEALRQELRHVKALHADGVVVDCWWGIVEGWTPNNYQWSGYRDMFNIVREFSLKLQVVLAFHENSASGTGAMPITLPKWVLEIGKDNQDIFFTDREGRRNTECLSWGIDKERVLSGRTGVEVYFDFMRSFRMEFNDLFEEGLISSVEIGLGASGELKYPSFSERMGWRYPGLGEFQCYDKYSQQNLRRAAKLRGHSFWARGPDNAGNYNSKPHETGFFCDRGDYDSYYGRFFLHWYAQTLIDHADQILSLASLAFEGTQLVVKIPAVYWWYRTCSHAAELTAGFYNPTNQDGYSPVFNMLKKHSVTMKFAFPVPKTTSSTITTTDSEDAFADAEGLSWQVVNSAWERGLSVAGQSSIPCHDTEACIRLVDTAKPRNDPDRRHLTFFTYLPLSPIFMQDAIFLSELDSFIKCMHGEIPDNIEAALSEQGIAQLQR